jgi:hypothetical protein
MRRVKVIPGRNVSSKRFFHSFLHWASEARSHLASVRHRTEAQYPLGGGVSEVKVAGVHGYGNKASLDSMERDIACTISHHDARELTADAISIPTLWGIFE